MDQPRLRRMATEPANVPANHSTAASTFLVMGPSGCGKTTIGRILAKHLRIGFIDADDFHGSQNRAKMASGIPLDDDDRLPWLIRLNGELLRRQQRGDSVVIACSALKESYRKNLFRKVLDPVIIWLDCSPAVLSRRLTERTDHFMPPELLQSQLDTLEPPTTSIRIDGDLSEKQIVRTIEDALAIR